MQKSLEEFFVIFCLFKFQAMTDPPASESLLEEHMERWTQVRRRWKNANGQNEERYSDSLNFLKAMFEN